MQLHELFWFFIGFVAAFIVLHSARSIAYAVAAFFTLLIVLNVMGVNII